MNIVIAIVAGLLLGWGASIRSGTDGLEDLIRNVIVGAVGALLGGWMLSAVYDAFDPSSFTVSAVVASLLGAAASLIVVNRIRRA
jgi:uncharacterized membrane protein YeaQ/YmgE (transglycosylase-associated protein family)